MTITFDPNGGDLGRAEIGPISTITFRLVLPHILLILEELYKMGNSQLPYKYAFEFYVGEREYALREILLAEVVMPKVAPHVKFYDCDGEKLFTVRGVSGGLVTSLICYLYTNYRR